MTSFLGIRTEPRQSSLPFKSIGQHFRSGQKVSDIVPSFSPTGDGDSDPLFRYPAYFIASMLEKRAILTGTILGSTLKKMVGWFDPPVVVAFGARNRLEKLVVEDLGLVEGVGAGQFKYGYYSNKRLRLADMRVLFGHLDFSNCSVDTGFRSRGLCKQAVEVMATLDRLVTGYLQTCQRSSNVFYRDSTDDMEEGWTPVKVQISIDEEEEVTLDGGKAVIGKEYGEIHNISDDDALLAVFLEDHALGFPSITPDSISSYGHAFRFVPGTLPTDGEYYGRLIARHFLPFFDSATKALSISLAISKHIPAIRNSGIQSEELLFAVIMMGCSLEAQSPVELIREGGRVLGAILKTDDPMLHDGQVVEYLDDDNTKAAVESWTTSSKARAIVASALSSQLLKNGSGRITCLPGSIDTSTNLLTQIAMRKRITTFTDDFLNALPYLGYEFEALPASTDNLIRTLRAIHEGEPTSNIYWCKEIFTCDSVNLAAHLSSFGPSSISFLNPNGSFVTIYSSAKDDPKTKEKKEKVIEAIGSGKKGKKRVVELKKEIVKFWDRITVTRVSIEIAIRDFVEFRATSKIRQVVGYDSRILGTVDIHPIEDDNSLLSALRLFGKDFDASEAAKDVVIRKKGVDSEAAKKQKVDMDLGLEL